MGTEPKPAEYRALFKRALLKLDELQARLDDADREKTAPIAIIGMGCRIPGGAHDPESYWRLLRDGIHAVTEVPRDRWDADALSAPEPEAPGTAVARHGAFLDRVDGFDAHFFGISPREATSMDPQQRLLLEVSWEALERAGQSPARLLGTPTGVFMGVSALDYRELLNVSGDLGRMELYAATGNSASVAAGRLSYVLGLQGPSLTVDTACSSSLVAVHLACQSLRMRETDLALAGGVNVMLSPTPTLIFSRARMLTADGRCKAFDTRADGFVRGEGCGVVVLKRLSDALADRDSILAVIRGTAVNQDGRSSGLTAPNGPAQEAVIRAALRNGGVAPSELSYVEAHGTGTELGDPIEVRALGAVLGQGRPPAERLLIGSVKTNIGHLEAAAGVAGLIKVVLALQHRAIPPHLHLRERNPHVAWGQLPIDIPTTLTPWSPAGGRRLAGVSSFGFSGTNAHVVLEEPPERAPEPAAPERPRHVLTLSARREEALRALATRYAMRLAADPAEALADVCFTANAGRAHFGHRVAVVADTLADAREKVAAVAAGTTPAGVRGGVVRGGYVPGVALLFTGQGAQYVGMGRGLYETQPTFRAALERCEEILRGHLDRPLLRVLYPEAGTASPLEDTAYAQPALFAVEWALAELWRAWGVEPAVVLGHSVGEYVAACVAGVMELEDALRVIAARGRLMGALPPGGAMAAVLAEPERVAGLVGRCAGAVAVAAVNGPQQVVVSGAREAVEAVLQVLEAEGVEARRLRVSHAFHSPLMAPMLGTFGAITREVAYRAPRVGWVSTLTGEPVRGALDGEYWVRQARETVEFARAVRAAAGQGCGVFLEAGPSPVLIGLGRASVPDGVWVGSLRRGRVDWEPLLDAVAALYVAGVPVDWAGFDRDYQRRKVVLPTYPFQRQRYWIESGGRSAWLSPAGLAGARAGAWSGEPLDAPTADLRLSGQTGARPTGVEGPSGLLYEVAWEPRGSADCGAPAWLRAPGRIGERLRPEFARLSAEHGLDGYGGLATELDAASGAYVRRALGQLGWAWGPGDRVTVDSVVARLGVVPAHRRLLGRLLGVLAEDGVLRPEGSGWVVDRVPVEANPEDRLARMMDRYPALTGSLRLFGRCGRALASVLRGETDPLQLLFGDGTETEALYEDSPFARAYNGLVRAAIATALEGLPPGREVRVLEIGAGTGGTTGAALAALPPDRTAYVFTDVSPAFTGRAQEKFRDHPFVRYRVLDIERDPDAQGFEPHAFDVVLAANVLHATRNLRETLAHVRRLLAPEGLLVLLEGTIRQRWVDLVFGLTEGWWRFADTDLRPTHGLLSQPRWRALLGEMGFVDPVTVPDESADDLSRQALVLARAPRAVTDGARAGATAAGRWLVLADAGGVGARLAAQLTARGEACVLACPGASYARAADGTVRLHPERRAEFEWLVREVLAAEGAPWRGVVHLWNLDATPPAATTPASLAADAARGCGSLLHLVQALVAAPGSASPRLWVVTRGAQAAEPEPAAVAVAQAPAWGLGSVIGLEHPELTCVRVDLDPAGLDDEATALLGEIGSTDGEDQVALRRSGRYVARLVPRGVAPAVPAAVSGDTAARGAPVAMRGDGTYLITGGLAGLGLLTARWLAGQGARHLVLMGRSAPTDAAREALRELEQAGIEVVVERGDVSRADDLARVLSRIGRAMPPLRGVVHSAGVLDDGVLLQQRWERFVGVMAPKVQGAWHLHAATRDAPLDFFVLFSSVASVLGSPGQGNHAAANAFLDALARHRRAERRPAVSLNWGPWAEIGAAAARDVARSALQGVGTIAPERGLRVLADALGQPSAQLAVMPVDWARLRRSHPRVAGMPLLVRLVREEPAASPGPDVPAATGLTRAALTAAGPAERRQLLEVHLGRHAARVLRIAESALDAHEALNAMGLDSLMALELKNRIEVETGVVVPLARFLQGASVAGLVEDVLGEMRVGGDGASIPPGRDGREGDDPKTAETLLAKLDELSDEQVAALLKTMTAAEDVQA